MYKILLLGMTFLTGNVLFSQGFQVNFQGQKQQGMGGAGNALPVDAASVFFNPGSVSFLKENSVNIGFTPTFANTLFEDANTTSIGRTNSPMGTPFSAYAVYRKNEESKFFYGLGIYTPFGSTIQYEDGWTGRFALTKLQLKSIFVQPTLSYKINDKIDARKNSFKNLFKCRKSRSFMKVLKSKRLDLFLIFISKMRALVSGSISCSEVHSNDSSGALKC
jgi:long-chain fatty acid transport protein